MIIRCVVLLLPLVFALACTRLPGSQTPLPKLSFFTPATQSPDASLTRPRGTTPAWWPSDLALPNGAEPLDSKGRAVWRTPDTNADGIRDFLLAEGKNAGYQTYVIALSPSSIYDLLFVKGGVTYVLNITQGIDATVLTGDRVGTMHLEITVVSQVTIDLPLRERFDLTPGSETTFGTSVPNPRCSGCEYLVWLHIAPFNGPGVYRSSPAGTYLVEMQLDPGGDLASEDYRWAQECTVIIKDAQSGSFACAGLQNVNDQSKRLNVVGSWQQPP